MANSQVTLGGRYYVLDDRGNPVVEDDYMEWAEWHGTHDKSLCHQIIGKVRVSTIFLAIDHNFCGSGPPILFETMILGGEHDGEQYRYATKEEAMKGHAAAVALARAVFSLSEVDD